MTQRYRKWLRIMIAAAFVLAFTFAASALDGEVTIPVPSDSPSDTWLRSDEVYMKISPEEEVYAKFTIPERAEIWIDLYQNPGMEISYDLFLADRTTKVTSYTRKYYGNDPYLSDKLIAGVLPAGTYYLRFYDVKGSEFCREETTLQFITKYYEEVDPIADDADEPNDSREAATRIDESKTGYLSYLGGDPCDWYTFDVAEDDTDFSLSMPRNGYISYSLYEKGKTDPVGEGIIDGNNFSGWENSFDAKLAKGSYDLCVNYEDYGADAAVFNYNRRGGMYEISVKKPVEEVEEPQPSGSTDDSIDDGTDTTSDTDYYYYDENGNPVVVDIIDYDNPLAGETTDTSTDATATGAAGTEAAAAVKVGTKKTVSAGTVKVTSTKNKTVAFTKAKNKTSVKVPAAVSIGGKTYKVTSIKAGAFKGKRIRTVTVSKNVKTISKNAFKGSGATKVIIKSKLLKKGKVKGCLKGSKVRTVQVKVSTKKSVNKKYVKKYKAYFTKKNAGMKVTVK